MTGSTHRYIPISSRSYGAEIATLAKPSQSKAHCDASPYSVCVYGAVWPLLCDESATTVRWGVCIVVCCRLVHTGLSSATGRAFGKGVTRWERYLCGPAFGAARRWMRHHPHWPPIIDTRKRDGKRLCKICPTLPSAASPVHSLVEWGHRWGHRGQTTSPRCVCCTRVRNHLTDPRVLSPAVIAITRESFVKMDARLQGEGFGMFACDVRCSFIAPVFGTHALVQY